MSANREQKSAWARRSTAEKADVGEIPAVVNPRRRQSCRFNLLKFLVTYFPESTGLSPFSEDHKRVIKRIEACILRGGRFVNAVYRGFAKTTISENAAIWAAAYGHRNYVLLFGANAEAGAENVESFQLELMENQLLAEDFPEICHPVAALEGKPQRCQSQTYCGNLTYIEFKAEVIALPTIRMDAKEAKAKSIPIDDDGYTMSSGAVLRARGITAGTRGTKRKRPDGRQQRPDFVILDDPQTDEAAGSRHQVNKTLRLLRKAIMRLGGHKTQLACVINATVIEPDDVIDQLLDHKRNAAWQGERIPMLRSFAKGHEALWLGEYQRLREDYSEDDPEDQRRAHRACNKFYRKNRKAMDEGCVVSWKHCYISDDQGGQVVPEISAIQHAYNILIDDGLDAFMSECQQQPQKQDATGPTTLQAKDIRSRLNGLPRGTVPVWSTHLTAAIDVHDEILYWIVAAWGDGFTGSVIDYGTWPEQSRPYFAQNDPRPGISDVIREGGPEHKRKEALKRLSSTLLPKAWQREGGGESKIERCPVDSGYAADEVFEFCRSSPHSGVLVPSKGVDYGAKKTPMADTKPVKGEIHGRGWVLRLPGHRVARQLTFDTYAWATAVARRLATATGDPGALTLFGTDPETHALIADHFTSEFSTEVTAKGRTVEEWQCRVGQDNHWWDCVKGAAAAASLLGVLLPGQEQRGKRRSVRFSDLQAQKRIRD